MDWYNLLPSCKWNKCPCSLKEVIVGVYAKTCKKQNIFVETSKHEAKGIEVTLMTDHLHISHSMIN